MGEIQRKWKKKNEAEGQTWDPAEAEGDQILSVGFAREMDDRDLIGTIAIGGWSERQSQHTFQKFRLQLGEMLRLNTNRRIWDQIDGPHLIGGRWRRVAERKAIKPELSDLERMDG